jgi:hypothetical protein
VLRQLLDVMPYADFHATGMGFDFILPLHESHEYSNSNGDSNIFLSLVSQSICPFFQSSSHKIG